MPTEKNDLCLMKKRYTIGSSLNGLTCPDKIDMSLDNHLFYHSSVWPLLLATVAQLVEHLTRNEDVCGSIPHGGSNDIINIKAKSLMASPFFVIKLISNKL